jgi:basic amino acid/polyamine antiporter, APA family
MPETSVDNNLENQAGPGLARRLGLTVLILYGVGDILGAGIYALVGKVAGIAGSAAWISFILSGILALVTGLSYAELSSRIPRSAGAAAFSARAFKNPLIPGLVGILVLTSGITSSATVSLAFYGYLNEFIELAQLPAAIGLLALINLVSFLGIHHSVRTNNILTAIELFGLLLVIGVGLSYALGQQAPRPLTESLALHSDWGAVFLGVTLAFYAFIGFEDLANLAEEAKDPSRDLPRAILVSIALSTVLYLLVILTVLGVMSPEDAARSPTPLLEVMRIGGIIIPPEGFALIAMIAIANTGLANAIMASRLLYGMAHHRLLPAILMRVHPHRQTPWVAIGLTFALSVLLVVTGRVSILAQTTTLLLTLAFFMAHLSLIIVRKQQPSSAEIFRVPGFIPYLGLIFCALLLTHFPLEAYLRAAVLIGISTALYLAYFKTRATRVKSYNRSVT